MFYFKSKSNSLKIKKLYATSGRQMAVKNF